MNPSPIRTDGSNVFAHNTMTVRVPNIIRETQELNASLPDSFHDELDALRLALETDAPIRFLPSTAPDYDLWLDAFAVREGETWLNTEWFFAETYCYRLIMDAVRWHTSGFDPFAAKKAIEITGEPIRRAIDHALSVPAEPTDVRLRELLLHSLWGNRVDLSYAVAASHGHASDADILVDNSEIVIARLLTRKPGHVHIILDNVGTELAMDLILADALLNSAADRVTLHAKDHPTFVSDATRSDVLSFLNEMARQGMLTKGYGEGATEVGERLQSAILDDRLRIVPDHFWNSPYFLWDMPARLQWMFEEASLVIVKGDANYRRLVGDALWQPETAFSTVTKYFPAPLLALRSCKSDPVIGLPTGMAERLDVEDPNWRTNGRRGLIQFKDA